MVALQQESPFAGTFAQLADAVGTLYEGSVVVARFKGRHEDSWFLSPKPVTASALDAARDGWAAAIRERIDTARAAFELAADALYENPGAFPSGTEPDDLLGTVIGSEDDRIWRKLNLRGVTVSYYDNARESHWYVELDVGPDNPVPVLLLVKALTATAFALLAGAAFVAAVYLATLDPVEVKAVLQTASDAVSAPIAAAGGIVQLALVALLALLLLKAKS